VKAFTSIRETRAGATAMPPLMRILGATGLFAAFLLAAMVSFADSREATNALWNGSASEGGVGFWVYPVSGECPGLRLKAKPLVFAVRRQGSSEFSVSNLKYCFQLPERAGTPLVQCRSGGGRLFFDAATRRYGGEYSFQMTDGTRREGAFVAQFCPKSSSLPQQENKPDHSATRFLQPRDGKAVVVTASSGISSNGGSSGDLL